MNNTNKSKRKRNKYELINSFPLNLERFIDFKKQEWSTLLPSSVPLTCSSIKHTTNGGIIRTYVCSFRRKKKTATPCPFIGRVKLIPIELNKWEVLVEACNSCNH